MLNGIRRTLSMIRECVVMSFDNIRSNKVRSFLTVLGILIGVMAVITLITTLNGFSGSLASSFQSMGAGTLNVSIKGNDLKSGLPAADLDEIAQLPEVKGLTPSVSLKARVSRGGEYASSVSIGDKNAYYFHVNDVLRRGRKLNIVDERNTSAVCLVSQDIIDQFFFGVDPVGQELYIGGIPFLVVGTYSDENSESLMRMFTGSPGILIPYTTALKMNSTNVVTSATIYLADGVGSAAAKEAISPVLDAMFSFEDGSYSFTDMSSVESTMNNMLGMVSTLLAGIASIALLVGGIGIMNMMLTTVTERTAEIGLKKALGAIPWQIQMQFLIESFMLSLIGGILGVVLGIFASLILSQVMNTAFSISPEAIALGVGFSAAVGVIFGWTPARKASRLNPIDALRSM